MERLRATRVRLEQVLIELDRLEPSLLRLVGFSVFLFGLGRVLMLVFQAHVAHQGRVVRDGNRKATQIP